MSIVSEEKCFFCGAKSEFEREPRRSRSFYRCPNCGDFYINDFAEGALQDSSKKALLAGYLYETREARNECLSITTEEIPKILASEKIPHTTMQKLEKLLINIYKQNTCIGQEHKFHGNTPASIAYAISKEEVFNMLYALDDLGWLNNFKPVGGDDRVLMTLFSLSVDGLDYAEKLLTTNTDSKKVFVAMGFKDDLLEACETAIKPACKACGFDAFLVSDKEHNNNITDEIIVGIKTSKFVITDFTYNNCGAYFEAGYAQGHGREVIRCCKKEWFDQPDNRLHFDVDHYNFILWESCEDLYTKLKSRIRASIDGAILTDKSEKRV